MKLISSTTLNTAASSVIFSSIPQTYTDLVLIASARTDRSFTYDEIFVQPNSNSTTTNYSSTYVAGYSGTVSHYNTGTGDGYSGISGMGIPGAPVSTEVFGSTELYIPNYTTSSKKATFSTSIQENIHASNYYITLCVQQFHDTTAISSLNIVPAVGPNFIANSSFYLYGVKNS